MSVDICEACTHCLDACKEMMRSSSRSTVTGAAREDLRSQPRGVSGGHPSVSNKPKAPPVRKAGGPISDGNQGELASPVGNSRLSSTTQAKISSSRGSNNGAKPVTRGSSSFMGSSRGGHIKKEDVKPVVYINRERHNISSRIPSATTAAKDHNGNAASRNSNAEGRQEYSIGTVSKVLGNSNRKDNGGVITKTSKAALVDNHGGGGGGGLDSIGTVTRVLGNLNRPSNTMKTNQPNKSSARAPTNNSQSRDDDGGDAAAEQQNTGYPSGSNRKEDNAVQKPVSDLPSSRIHKEQTKADLHIIIGESSSPRAAEEAAVPKLTPPQPHPEVRGCPARQDYLMQEWMQGPSNPDGQVVNVSDRPSLCMSVSGTEACIGSSDHALYIVDCQKCTFVRALYGKQYGHTEWVTCCDYLQDGRILSGGMDGKLCLWDKKGVRAIDLKGHMASISAVKAGAEGSFAVSASYDKTLMLWNVNRLQTKAAACLRGHKTPVLGFCLSSQGSIVSGSRDGDVILWDTARATPLLHVSSAHEGHVTAVECLEDTKNETWEECREMYLTGGQDGILQAWDFRTRGPVHSAALHRNAVGKGAVSNIDVSYTARGSGPIVVTAGADNLIKVLEPRMGFKVLHTVSSHRDFIYSLHVAGPLVWSGSGDGSLLVHELLTGQCLYGLGADSKGAVRCISLAGPDRLVAAGDDGNVMIYNV